MSKQKTEISKQVKSGKANNPHDAFFRAMTAIKQLLGWLLKEHLPAEIAEKMDVGRVRILDGGRIDAALSNSQSDRLVEVGLKSGGMPFVYVLLEHKSTADVGTPLQLTNYMVGIWQQYAEGKAARLKNLPPIIPLVFYHGEAAWNVPSDLAGCMAGDESLHLFKGVFGYLLRDLRRMKRAALSADPVLRACLSLLRAAPDLASEWAEEALREIAPEINVHILQGPYLQLRAQVLSYIVTVSGLSREQIVKLFPKGEDVMQTLAQQWFAEGEATGIAKGEATGIAKGEAKGRVETLSLQLQHKFGSLPQQAQRRLEQASSRELEVWTERVLDAESLDAVFGEQRH